MTTIFDATTLHSPNILDLGQEKFLLSRKNGRPTLQVKSPLFERYFREQSDGKINDLVNPLWGVPQYNFQIDAQVDAELRHIGLSFGKGMKGLWMAPNKYETPVDPGATQYIFNVGFLLCQGIENGLAFPLKDNIPLSLIEGPDFIFVNTLKKGFYHVIRQFMMDYDVSISINTDVRKG